MDLAKCKHGLNRYQVAFLLILSISTSKALYEGDNCVVPTTGENGKCISVMQCDYAKKLLQANQRPEHCGFNSKYPLVCCPVSQTGPPPGQRSIEKCNKYLDISKLVYAAASGTKALPKEFLHMAAVGYGEDKNNILWLCGGSLISTSYVLTAAHCLYSKEFGFVKWVRLGDLDLKNTTEEANPEDLAVIQFFKHPDYKSPEHYHDVALLKLERQVYFGPFIKPACLYTGNEFLPNKLQATGWGKTAFIGDSSSHLIKVDLDVIDSQRCKNEFSNKSPKRLPNGVLDQIQICAGDLTGTGRDTCPGDSGGPLHFMKPQDKKLQKRFVLVGITSFGKGCGLGETVGVYTRVSAYLEWIENIVWPVNSYSY